MVQTALCALGSAYGAGVGPVKADLVGAAGCRLNSVLTP